MQWDETMQEVQDCRTGPDCEQASFTLHILKIFSQETQQWLGFGISFTFWRLLTTTPCVWTLSLLRLLVQANENCHKKCLNVKLADRKYYLLEFPVKTTKNTTLQYFFYFHWGYLYTKCFISEKHHNIADNTVLVFIKSIIKTGSLTSIKAHN